EHRLQRVRVQPQRAVGQVVVVDQDELAAGHAAQRRHVGDGPFDVELLAEYPHQLAGRVVVVAAAGQPVPPDLNLARQR
ncbi:hypothetical protein DKX15_21775, partial [Enterococcus faecium]